MVVYRSPMEKILDQNENNTVITNSKDPGRTFLRKIAYRFACWWNKIQAITNKNKKS
jgi:hypothetical protein